MPEFVELTDDEGRAAAVNPAHVALIQERSAATSEIVLAGRYVIAVLGKVEEIAAKLKGER